MCRISLANTLLWATVGVFGLRAALPQETRCGIVRHPETLRLFDAFFAAEEDTPQYWKVLSELGRLAKSDPRRFVKQTILYDLEQKKMWATWYLIWMTRVKNSDVMEALAPLLYCEDEGIRESASRMLPAAFFLARNEKDVLELSELREFPRQVRMPLIRALFELRPVDGFFYFTGEQSDRPDLQGVGNAEREIDPNDVVRYRTLLRTVDNALYRKKWLDGIPGGKVDPPTRDALRELAGSKYWWSRLFVAEIMVQNKEFRDPELVKQLEQDENELVRNSIASLTKPDPLRITPVDQ